MKIVYFTIVPLGEYDGGSLCCRNHIEKIASCPEMDLMVVCAAEAVHEVGVVSYLRNNGLKGSFVTLEPRSGKDLSWISRKWPFPHETQAQRQDSLRETLKGLVRKHRAQAIIVDYVQSAFYCLDIFTFGVPVIIITLNREAEFYKDQLKHGLTVNGRPGTWVAGHRIRWAERSLYRKSAAVVAIGKYDVPRPSHFKRSKSFVVPPILDPEPPAERWRFSNTRSLFFVGRIGHYPNREAIEWLAAQLSPALSKLDPTIAIKIVGATADDVPPDWRRDNIRFLGVSTRSDVQALFRTEDLFIAPIYNNYGAKLKVAEAMAYGTPFLASAGALSGILDYSGSRRDMCWNWLTRLRAT